MENRSLSSEKDRKITEQKDYIGTQSLKLSENALYA